MTGSWWYYCDCDSESDIYRNHNVCILCDICGKRIMGNIEMHKESVHMDSRCRKVGNKRNYEKGLYV